MNEFKLVPFEPTPEMVEAAEDAYMPFGDMDLALRMAILAAPDVQKPAPDVSALVEALEDIGASWHGVNTELERYMRNVARRAIAPHRRETKA